MEIKDLKQTLIAASTASAPEFKKNYLFKSQTDTEVITVMLTDLLKSEDLDKSMVVWNSVGGNNDVNSPHNIELLDAEKMKGDYDLVILKNTYELLSSTTYNVSISGTDPAGNESEPFVIKNVDYY